MAHYPSLLLNEKEIEAGVQRAAEALADKVVRIRYSFEEDWTGDPSIFFRIVLTDKAAKAANLAPLAQSISNVVRREAQLDGKDLNAYFNYRAASEHGARKDPDWR